MLSLNPWDLGFTVINLLVLFWLIKKFLFKPVNEVLRKREELVNGQLTEAKKKMDEAEEAKVRYERSLTAAKQESMNIIFEARKSALAEQERIVKIADMEAEKIIEEAKKTAELEHSKALRNVESEIAEMAVKAAEKILTEHSSEERNRDIYNQFLTKVGEPRD